MLAEIIPISTGELNNRSISRRSIRGGARGIDRLAGRAPADGDGGNLFWGENAAGCCDRGRRVSRRGGLAPQSGWSSSIYSWACACASTLNCKSKTSPGSLLILGQAGSFPFLQFPEAKARATPLFGADSGGLLLLRCPFRRRRRRRAGNRPPAVHTT